MYCLSGFLRKGILFIEARVIWTFEVKAAFAACLISPKMLHSMAGISKVVRSQRGTGLCQARPWCR